MKDFYSQEYFEKRDILASYLSDLVTSIAKKHQLKRILDVGCGTGRLVEYLNKQSFSTNKQGFSTNKQSFSTNKQGFSTSKNGFDAHGCDTSKKALLIARKLNLRGKIANASATKLPYTNESFDMVTSISVIEHLTPKQAQLFIKEAKRVLVPGGHIFLVTPNFSTPLRLIHGKNWFAYQDPTHIKFYTPLSLTKLLKRHGFGKIQFSFKLKYRKSFVAEFPLFFPKLPRLIKILLIYLVFSTPLSVIRNSFWLDAQKS